MGGQVGFDVKHGPLFIDENFASVRGLGDAIGIHSGGHKRTKRTQFRQFNGQFFLWSGRSLDRVVGYWSWRRRDHGCPWES